jgi:hypothetical protein
VNPIRRNAPRTKTRKHEKAAAALLRAASGKTPMAAIAGGHRAKLELNSRSS